MFFKKNSEPSFYDMLDKVLFNWTAVGSKNEPFRLADAVRGIQVFGGTGMGKSSGSGQHIARAYIKHGFGGVVACAKPGEADTFRKFAREYDREDDLVVFNETSGLSFNPILYESVRPGKGTGQTMVLVDLIMSGHLLGKNLMAGSSTGGGDAFWDNATRRLLSRCIDLLKLAEEPVNYITIRNMVVSALTPEDVKAYREFMEAESETAEEELEAFRSENYCLDCLIKAALNEKTEDEQDTYNLVSNYFLREFANLAERTRSSIEEHFYGLIEPFLTGILKKHFSGDLSNVLWPETTYQDGKIIILDFSVKNYGVAGLYAQGLFLHSWMQAMERRSPEGEDDPRPVFLFADESHFFINPDYSAMFQTTARSALVCTVYLTQSINNYYTTFGSHMPEARTKSLLANMGCKVFHASSDFDTNVFASNIVGHSIAVMGSMSGQPAPGQVGNLSEQMMLEVQPNEFVKLKYGRKENDNIVESYIIKTGPWKHTNKSYIKAEFKQK